MIESEIKAILNEEYDVVVEKTVKALKNEGFGVITEINVKKTLKEKLDVDFERYIILGACNPALSKRALDIEREIGLLLPCNIIIQELEEGKATKVTAIDPEKMFEMIESPQMEPIVREVKSRLQRVIVSLTG